MSCGLNLTLVVDLLVSSLAQTNNAVASVLRDLVTVP